MILCNAGVWTLFVKALQSSDSSLVATVMSAASNYLISVSLNFLKPLKFFEGYKLNDNNNTDNKFNNNNEDNKLNKNNNEDNKLNTFRV